VAAVSAELGAILLKKLQNFHHFCATLLILRTLANSVQNPARTESQNSDIANYNNRTCLINANYGGGAIW